MAIDIAQTATGGLARIIEKRTLDWEWQHHSDYVFGSLKHRSQLIGGSPDRNGIMRPLFELQTESKAKKISDFLRAEILPDGTISEGFLVNTPIGEDSTQKGSWVHTFAKNEGSGWTAEQVRSPGQSKILENSR
jgi:hypothetical protein